MKVYLLYVDKEVVGVFTSTEKAQQYRDDMNDDNFEAEVYVETQEVDPITPELEED